MRGALAIALFFVFAAAGFGQKMSVKIIDRKDSESSYDFIGIYGNTAIGRTFTVRGATFMLELPDGRLAVVNCESKFRERMAGPAGNHRSCRAPIVGTLDVVFKGDGAKLIWPVSLDGKKMQSETYKILGVLDKPLLPAELKDWPN